MAQTDLRHSVGRAVVSLDVRRGEGRAFTGAAELEVLYRSSFEPTTGPRLIFLSTNNASARGLMGISRERHSYRKAHTHIFFECRPKYDPRGNAKPSAPCRIG